LAFNKGLKITPDAEITANVNKSSAVAELGDRLATTDMGRKVGRELLCPDLGGAGSPTNTMWRGPRTTSKPSDIPIHQHHRHDRQTDNDPIG